MNSLTPTAFGSRAAPGEVEPSRTLLAGAHAVLPAVARDEVAARVAHDAHPQVAGQVEDVLPEALGVGRGVVGLVDAGVDAPSHVLDERPEQAAVHVPDGERRVEAERCAVVWAGRCCCRTRGSSGRVGSTPFVRAAFQRCKDFAADFSHVANPFVTTHSRVRRWHPHAARSGQAVACTHVRARRCGQAARRRGRRGGVGQDGVERRQRLRARRRRHAPARAAGHRRAASTDPTCRRGTCAAAGPAWSPWPSPSSSCPTSPSSPTTWCAPPRPAAGPSSSTRPTAPVSARTSSSAASAPTSSTGSSSTRSPRAGVSWSVAPTRRPSSCSASGCTAGRWTT